MTEGSFDRFGLPGERGFLAATGAAASAFFSTVVWYRGGAVSGSMIWADRAFAVLASAGLSFGIYTAGRVPAPSVSGLTGTSMIVITRSDALAFAPFALRFLRAVRSASAFATTVRLPVFGFVITPTTPSGIFVDTAWFLAMRSPLISTREMFSF